MPSSARRVNPEIEEERKLATFQVKELTNLIDGGPDATQERKKYENALLQYPVFKDPSELLSISPENSYGKGLQISMELRNLTEKDPVILEMLENNKIFIFMQLHGIVLPFSTPLALHTLMFTATIESQGSEEQKKKWLPLAKKFEIIGTYCQTELGHGTNMRGLETTATYDPKTEEFVLNSPTLTSTKFWPGGLSYSCNFAIVICQLYIQGKCKGLHLFIVQLRDLKEHSPLPGLKVGSIGPKMGMHAMDNGFLHFKNYRIPRDHMLMKYAQVLKDGTYVSPPRERAGYGVFFHSRVYIAVTAAFNIARGTTIAVRYGAVRHQGEIVPGKPEVQILNYPTYQNKLFPHIAMAYSIIIACKRFPLLLMNAFANPTPDNIAELHALSSGMKAFCTQASVDALEQCRLCCGGLGFLQATNLPILFCDSVASCTYEGDNIVMLLQTARYLVKSYRSLKQSTTLPDTVAFLAVNNAHPITGTSFKDLTMLFKKVTCNIISEVVERMDMQLSGGQIPEVVWNEHTNQLVKCAKLYCHCFLLESFENFCSEIEISSSLQAVLMDLYELLPIYWIQQNAALFIQFSEIDGEFLKILDTRWEKLLELLRPNAVALVDGFDFRDEALHSILGCYDGNVYERIFDYVQTLPMTGKVHPAFKKWLQPALVSKI